MTLFPGFRTIKLSSVKKVANSSTPAGKVLKLINEQIDMVNGKAVFNANGSAKRSWFVTVEENGKQVEVFSPRIANSLVLDEPPVVEGKEEKLQALEFFKNWQDHPEIKKAILERFDAAKEAAEQRAKNKKTAG